MIHLFLPAHTPANSLLNLCLYVFFFKQGIHMHLPEDIFQKEVSHRLNRPARLSNEKVNNNQFLYTNSVLKITTHRDKQLNAKVVENL